MINMRIVTEYPDQSVMFNMIILVFETLSAAKLQISLVEACGLSISSNSVL